MQAARTIRRCCGQTGAMLSPLLWNWFTDAPLPASRPLSRGPSRNHCTDGHFRAIEGGQGALGFFLQWAGVERRRRRVTQMTHVNKIAVCSARVLIFGPPRPVCCSLPRGDRGDTVRGDSEAPEGAPLNSWPVRWCANSAGEFGARTLSE